MKCKKCLDVFDEPGAFREGEEICVWCSDKERFSKFAMSCGLSRYPDPTGERYVYKTDGRFDGKKSECVDFIDDLWNALVKAKDAGDSLIIGG